MQDEQSVYEDDQTPKGRLLIIGGHEDKTYVADKDAQTPTVHGAHFGILSRLRNDTPHKHDVIEIIATASSIPEEMEETYINAYKLAGYNQVAFIKIENAEDANNEANVTRIHYAHAVFFTGGDQRKLTNILNGTDVLAAIKKKYYNDSNFIVAGTSAGAMSVPEIIIERGAIEEMLLKKDLIINKGFGLIKNVIVDTHFVKRGRIGRLALAVGSHTECTGIGLGEDGALLITNGDEAECVGTGMVIIIDGSEIKATNISKADENTPVAMENLKIHILTEGCKYLIREKKFILG